MIGIRFGRRTRADVRRLRSFIIDSHPDGLVAGRMLADGVATRLALAIESLREFPRLGHPSVIPGLLELTVPGPTRRLTCTVG